MPRRRITEEDYGDNEPFTNNRVASAVQSVAGVGLLKLKGSALKRQASEEEELLRHLEGKTGSVNVIEEDLFDDLPPTRRQRGLPLERRADLQRNLLQEINNVVEQPQVISRPPVIPGRQRVSKNELPYHKVLDIRLSGNRRR